MDNGVNPMTDFELLSMIISAVAFSISIIAMYLVHFRGSDIVLLTREQEEPDYQVMTIFAVAGSPEEVAEIRIRLPFLNQGAKSGIILKAKCDADLAMGNIDEEKWREETGKEWKFKTGDLGLSCYFKQPKEYEGSVEMPDDLFFEKTDFPFVPVIIKSNEGYLAELRIQFNFKREKLLGTLLRHCKEMNINIKYDVTEIKGFIRRKGTTETREKNITVCLSNVRKI